MRTDAAGASPRPTECIKSHTNRHGFTHSFQVAIHAFYRISKITTQANSRVQSRNGSEKYTDAPARSLSA